MHISKQIFFLVSSASQSLAKTLSELSGLGLFGYIVHIGETLFFSQNSCHIQNNYTS